MEQTFIRTHYFTLLTLFLLYTACNGQVISTAQNNKENKQVVVANEQPKLIKTQGTDQYAMTRCGLQDKAGNMWFGTTGEGVYRYDGKIFTQFTINDGLSSNKVWSILEDTSGNIWFGTTDGVCRYDGENIRRIPIHEKFAPLSSNNDYYNDWSTRHTIWSMLQDKSGKIWFGTGDGVFCYNGTQVTRFLDNDSIINREGLHLTMVGSMIEDRKGNIWLASGMLPGQEGLCRFDGKSITRFNPGGDGWIRYVLEDKNGIIWSSGRHHGNWIYDGTSFTNFTEKVGIGAPLLVDKSGNIWFSGEENTNGYEGNGGVWVYDGKSFQNFTTNDGMGNFGVWCIVEDRAGNIWLGTKNVGLYKYDGNTFTRFSE